MNVKFGAHVRTKTNIKSLLANEETRLIAVVAAAIYFEWSFRRFVCVFGRDSVSEIQGLFNELTGGYSSYRRMFLHQLDRPKVIEVDKKGRRKVIDRNESADKALPGSQATGITVADVIKGWAHLSDNKSSSAPVRLRNAIVHGSINSVSFGWASHAVRAYLAAVEDLEKFCNVHFESLFAKLRTRKKWAPNEKLKKAIALVNEKPSKLINDPAYARQQRRWILPLVEVRQGKIDLVAYRRRKKSALDRCKLCKPYLKA